jgi:hypothetical protein
MKKIILLVLSALASASFCMAQSSAYKTTATSSTEVFSTKILKVYEAHSQEGVYIAYAVDWRGQEVIVTQSATKEPLKVGDEIECTMTSPLLSIESGKKATLRFAIGNTSHDAERLEAIRSEVKRRRDARGAKDSGEKPAAAE